MIGYMYGLENAVGTASQLASNIAGRIVGKEILRVYKEEGFEGSIEEVPKMLSMFGDLKLEETEYGWYAEVSNCKICPKRIGGYEFEGTACPWPGILVGILEEITGEKYSITSKLIPGESCHIKIMR